MLCPWVTRYFHSLNTASADQYLPIYPALILLLLAGWVHRDISTGDIIVENGGSIRGFLSDLKYAKATNTQGSPSDPKTVWFDVKDGSCLKIMARHASCFLKYILVKNAMPPPKI